MLRVNFSWPVIRRQGAIGTYFLKRDKTYVDATCIFDFYMLVKIHISEP